MFFRFIGHYTNGNTSVASCGITFFGREPAKVTDADSIRRLSGNQEFEAVDPVEAVDPPKRGRPRKKDAE